MEYLEGWDISHWAGQPNWAQLSFEAPAFLIFKASDGNHERNRYMEHFDSQLLPNWFWSHQVMPGLPMDVYHWYANAMPVAEQIDLHQHALKLLTPAPRRSWLDLEEKTPGGSWADIRSWLSSIPCPGVYTSPGWLAWADKVWGPRPAWLAALPFWLAQYPYKLDLSNPPKSPAPWTKWLIWQVNKNHRVPGLPGGVSLDLCTVA